MPCGGRRQTRSRSKVEDKVQSGGEKQTRSRSSEDSVTVVFSKQLRVQVQIGVCGSAGNRVWRAPGVIAHDIPLFSSTGMCPEMDLWPAGASSDNLQRVTPPSSQDGAGGHKAIRSMYSEQVIRNMYIQNKNIIALSSSGVVCPQAGRKVRPSHISLEN